MRGSSFASRNQLEGLQAYKVLTFATGRVPGRMLQLLLMCSTSSHRFAASPQPVFASRQEVEDQHVLLSNCLRETICLSSRACLVHETLSIDRIPPDTAHGCLKQYGSSFGMPCDLHNVSSLMATIGRPSQMSIWNHHKQSICRGKAPISTRNVSMLAFAQHQESDRRKQSVFAFDCFKSGSEPVLSTSNELVRSSGRACQDPFPIAVAASSRSARLRGCPSPIVPFKVQNSSLWRMRGLVGTSLWQLYCCEYFNPH